MRRHRPSLTLSVSCAGCGRARRPRPSCGPPATISSESSPSASRRPAPWSAAVTGIVTHGLPDDELERYRPAIEAVTAEDVLAAARDHLDLERLGIVLVGDADAVTADVEGLGLGELEVIRDEDRAVATEMSTA